MTNKTKKTLKQSQSKNAAKTANDKTNKIKVKKPVAKAAKPKAKAKKGRK